MSYSKSFNFDTDIAKDLNSIKNSKVKKRVHNPKNKENINYGSKGQNKISYLPWI